MNRLQVCLIIFCRREILRLRVPFLLVAALVLSVVKHLGNLAFECFDIVLLAIDSFCNQGRRY